MPPTILILGGYGAVGAELGRILLAETEASLILAGRNAGRAEAAAAQVAGEGDSERVRGAGVDAADPAALEAALAGCDLVVVCVPISDLGDAVARAALRSGMDYLDINADPRKLQTLRAAGPEIERAGRRFVTEAGAFPGLPSLLARAAADRLDEVERLVLAMAFQESETSLGSATDMLGESGRAPRAYVEGRRRRVSRFRATRLDFGPPFGRRAAFPIDLAEAEDLPELLGAGEVRVYSSGLNPLADAIYATWDVLGLNRVAVGRRLGPGLLHRAMNRWARPPFGLVVRSIAEGFLDGRPARVAATARHDSGYTGTAIPVAACIRQLLEPGGTIGPGVSYMGHAVELHRFLGDLFRLGMTVEVD